jgi:hypothetical protein
LTIRAINLDNRDPMVVEEPRQANTPRPRTLNTNTIDLTIRCEPSKKFFETGLVSGERLDPEYPAIRIDHSPNMGIGVGIHTANNHPYH